MRVSREEERFINFAARLAWGVQGTKRPDWYFRELLEDLADVSWMPPGVRECAVARAHFLLRTFSAMDPVPAVASHSGDSLIGTV